MTTYTPAQLAAMPETQLNALAASVFASFSSAQAQALSAAQLNGLTKTNFEALNVSQLTASQLSALSATALGYLTAVQVAEFTTTQLNGLSKASFEALNVSQLTASQLSGLSATALGYLTAVQVAEFTTTQLNGLSKASFAALNVSQLTASQLSGLSAASFGSLTATQVGEFTTAQLNGLSKANFGALNVSQLTASQLSGLSAASFGSLTPTQVGEFTTAQISSLTASQVNALPLAALSKTQEQALTSAQISGMSTGTFNTLNLGNLQAAQFGGVNAAEMASISVANFDKYVLPSLGSVSPAGLAGVTLAQIESFSSAQINSLTAAQTAGLSGAAATYAKDYRGVFTALSSAESKGVLTFAGAESLLQAEAAGGSSAGKFAALQAVASSLNAAGGPTASAEVQQLFDDVVDGNAANRTWTGGAASSVALGNLSTTSTATQFNELIDKWFLGSDNSSIVGSGMAPGAYGTATGPLFVGTPSYAQVNQGDVGDCYFEAALGGLAQQDPSLIQNMITVNSNGTYTVDFYNNATKTRDDVTVNNQIAVMQGGYHFASGSTVMFDNGGASGAIWSEIVEKAFVQFDEQNGGANAYAAIAGGWDNGLTALTGQSVQDYFPQGGTAAQLGADLTAFASDLKAGNVVMMSTVSSALNLVASHMYDVLSVNTAAGTVTLDNPWNANGSAGGAGMVVTDSIASLASAGVAFHAAIGAARAA